MRSSALFGVCMAATGLVGCVSKRPCDGGSSPPTSPDDLDARIVFQADFDSADHLVTRGGTAALLSPEFAGIGTKSPLASGSGGYLCVARRPAPGSDGTAPAAGVTFTFESDQHSPNVWLSDAGGPSGNHTVDGVVDFFIRTESDQLEKKNQVRPLDIRGSLLRVTLRDVVEADNCNPRRLVFNSQFLQLEAERPETPGLWDPQCGLVSTISTEALTNAITLTAGGTYHIALVLETDTRGFVEMRVLVKPGGGAIDLSSDAPSARARFQIYENYFKRFGSALRPQAMHFGVLGGLPSDVQTFDRLRIWRGVPKTLPGL